MEIVQWGITAFVSILTFIGGRQYEKYRIAQSNRLALLVQIEDWVDQISRLIGIVGSEITAINAGLTQQVGYAPKDVKDTGRALSEKKEKVLGILESNALVTSGTKVLKNKLSISVLDLSILLRGNTFNLIINCKKSLGGKKT